LEGIDTNQSLALYLYRPLEDKEDLLHFKVIGCGQPMALSDVLPMLEHMGLRVLEAHPYEIEPNHDTPSWILDLS
jgi:glutamate dehydrogenase